MILPERRRSDSNPGYVQKCLNTNEMRKLPLAYQYKRQLCEEAAELQEKLLR